MIFTFQKSFFKFSKGKKWTNPDLKNKKFHPAIVAQQLSIDPGTQRSPIRYPVRAHAQSQERGMQEAADQWCFSLINTSPFLSL